MKHIVLVILCFNFMLSCTKSETTKCPDSVAGVIKDYTILDGCNYVIELSNGDLLEPNNLNKFDEDFLEDGLKVWVKYHEAPFFSICMTGTGIEIECLTKR